MNNNTESSHLTLKEASALFREFVHRRQWQKYHTPRNLILAMMGEVGEIAQIFQWKGEVEPGLPQFSEKQKTHVGQQIADIMSYLMRLADVCGIDVEAAVRDKIEKNKRKYPEEKIKENANLFLEIKDQRRVTRENQKQAQDLGEQKKQQ